MDFKELMMSLSIVLMLVMTVLVGGIGFEVSRIRADSAKSVEIQSEQLELIKSVLE